VYACMTDAVVSGCRSHLELAKELTLTCYELYNSTVTGLAPEIAYFNDKVPTRPSSAPHSSGYRPS
jgi:hypothetical protein